MVKRHISKDKYVVAGIITLVIFCMGIFLGMVVENKRVDLLETVYRQEAVHFQSSQIQYDFIQSHISNSSCGFVFDAYHQSLKDLDDTTVRLEAYSTNERINSGQFDILKREFLLTEIKYWLLADQIKEVCAVDMVPILYFHDTQKACPECDGQSFVLTYLKKKFGQNVLIFSFSVSDTNEPMVELLKTEFNITQTPSVVVNNFRTSGYVSRTDLEKQICGMLKGNHAECGLYKS